MKNPNKDYYKILGVDAKADTDSIKKAYRKLAMEHHPDKNQGDTVAEEKFKEISEAYEVLSNPDKRHMYDNRGSSQNINFGGFGFGGQSPFDIFRSAFGGNNASNQRQRIGADNKIVFRAKLAQIITGGNVRVEFTRHFACDDCKGMGIIESNSNCMTCGGSGQMQSNMAQMLFVTTCPKCRGTGKQSSKCPKCNGKAYTSKKEKANVAVPKGINPLTTLQIKNKGNQVYHNDNKVCGHTYLVVDYPQSENGVSLNMGRIYLSLRVPFNTTLAEEDIKVDVLGCKEIEFKLDSTKESGHEYVIKGAGVTEDKDAFIKVFIDSPKNKLSKEDREKLNKVMGEIYGIPPRQFKAANH